LEGIFLLWKDTYITGVEHIDRQHKELFYMTKHLLNTIKDENSATTQQECMDSIRFLKGYSVQHFETEEEYMRTVGYRDIEAHKSIHKGFTATVLKSEQKMLKYNFSMPVVKEFAGFLTAWLIYHVADIDQKIGNNEPISNKSTTTLGFYTNCFVQSISNVFKKMLDLTITNFTYVPEPIRESDVAVQIGLIGAHEGNAVFIFSPKTTLGLIKAMTFMELSEIDEIAYSALSEIANIISGNAASLIAESGNACDIKTPQIISETGGINNENGFYFNTEYGKISVCVNID